jgi:lysozyme family protein
MFEQAVERILKREGGYVNDANDTGGATKYGISEKSHPNIDIDNLTIDEAKKIYKCEYWDRSICEELPLALAFNYFDAIVNCGFGNAGEILQRAINRKLLSEEEGRSPIAVDGIVGPITTRWAKFYGRSLGEFFTIERIRYYVEIANCRPTNRKFLRGWLNRTLDY